MNQADRTPHPAISERGATDQPFTSISPNPCSTAFDRLRVLLSDRCMRVRRPRILSRLWRGNKVKSPSRSIIRRSPDSRAAATSSGAEKFIEAWISGELGLPVLPVRPDDLFEAYRKFSDQDGHVGHTAWRQFLLVVHARQDFKSIRSRYLDGSNAMSRFLVHKSCAWPDGMRKQQWFGASVEAFRRALDNWTERA